jgi:hypothetical protein
MTILPTLRFPRASATAAPIRAAREADDKAIGDRAEPLKDEIATGKCNFFGPTAGFRDPPLSVISGADTILPMTATGLLHVVTATIDALRHGRLSTPPAAAAPSTFAGIEMHCLRCGRSVKATCPPDEEGEGPAFQCTHCGTVARWV